MSEDITATFSLPITLKGDYLDDAISDVYGAISYWADYVSDNTWTGSPQGRGTRDDVVRFTVAPRLILTGAERIVRSGSEVKVGDDLRKQVLTFVLSAGCDYDAEVLDAIVQAAVFGELVYG